MISFINDFKINPNISKFYRVYVSEVKDEISTSADIHLMCLSASVAFKRLQNLGVRNILLTSGTLSPLDSFSIELGIPFEVKL
jgi:regulator of telomere elongation helicase 1